MELTVWRNARTFRAAMQTFISVCDLSRLDFEMARWFNIAQSYDRAATDFQTLSTRQAFARNMLIFIVAKMDTAATF